MSPRKRVRVLPSGRAEALTGRTYNGEVCSRMPKKTTPRKKPIPAEISAETLLFCPLCGGPVMVKLVQGTESRGRCKRCDKYFLFIQYTRATQTLVICDRKFEKHKNQETAGEMEYHTVEEEGLLIRKFGRRKDKDE